MPCNVRPIKFEPLHAAKMTMRPEAETFIAAMGEYALPQAVALSRHPSVTLIDRLDRIVALGGICSYWPGVGEAWMRCSPLADEYPLALTKAAWAFMETIGAHLQLRRLQATVRADYETGHRWAKRFGFEPEGLLRGYGPEGADYMLYARVKNGA